MDVRKGPSIAIFANCCVVSTHIMSCMTSMMVTYRLMHFAKGTVPHSITHITVSHTTLTACACALQHRLPGVLQNSLQSTNKKLAWLPCMRSDKGFHEL